MKERWTAVESNHHQPRASSTRGHSAIELAARVAAIVFTDGRRRRFDLLHIKALLTSLPVQQGKAQQSFLCVSLTSPLWGACSQNEKTRKIRAAEILEIHILFVDITAWAVYCQLPRPLFENGSHTRDFHPVGTP